MIYPDIILVAPDELERVRQCLTDPKERPSEAALEAAEFLRSLPAPDPEREDLERYIRSRTW